MSRWKPARAGIFNIWEYDDQIFEFGDGRLVLRGRNGSGKSNALSLIFPFVLDGVMSANRMDPMGGGRSMKSLLLGRDDDDASGGRYRYDSGSGYVWMEFERPGASDDSGDTDYITIGVGARATQQRDANAWFFVTPQRIGHGLELADDEERPKSQRQLVDDLDGAGNVYATAEDYRAAVDRALFGLGAVRWRTTLDLLLTLRRPHLAGKLDTDHLSHTLSSGLAELDPALVADVAHSFDDLDAMHDELDGVTGALEAVERFLPVYRLHLLGVARQRAGQLVAVDSEQRDVAKRLRMSEQERTNAVSDIAEATELARQNRRDGERVDAEIEAIQSSQAFQDAGALSEVEQRAAASCRAADSATDALHASRTQHDSAVAAKATADDRAMVAADRVDRAFGDWIDLARAVGLSGTPITVAEFDTDGAAAAISTRAADIVQVDELARIAADTAAEARRAVAARQRAEVDLREARHRQGEAETKLGQITAELAADLDAWVGHFDPITGRVQIVSGRTLVSVRSAWTDTAVGEPQLPSAIDAIVADARTALVIATERTEDAAGDKRRTIEQLLDERRRVAEEANPGPPADPTRPDAERPDRAGAPLYMCVDFADSVAEPDRAGLEAALDAAGLLDARIGATDSERDDVLDAPLEAIGELTADLSDGLTLADVLVPVPVGDLEVDRIIEVLRSVPLDTDLVRIGHDGSWRLGPLAGRFRKERAEFIGHEARATSCRSPRRSRRCARRGARPARRRPERPRGIGTTRH